MNRVMTDKTEEKLIWSPDDVKQALNISYASALVHLTRGVKRGEWVRLKNGVYIPYFRYKTLSREEQFEIANFLQVPSCISLTTALEYGGISTQIGQATIESVNPTRSIHYETPETDFAYFKIKEEYYFGIKKIGRYFMAEPEKALIDALYLENRGRYSLDRSALNGSRLDKKKLAAYIKQYKRSPGLFDFLTRESWKICNNTNDSK